MNYIHQLKRGLECRDAQLRSIDQDIVTLLAYLNGPKFTGEENGESKDWISTSDVIIWLRQMRSASIVAGETAVANFVPNNQAT